MLDKKWHFASTGWNLFTRLAQQCEAGILQSNSNTHRPTQTLLHCIQIFFTVWAIWPTKLWLNIHCSNQKNRSFYLKLLHLKRKSSFVRMTFRARWLIIFILQKNNCNEPRNSPYSYYLTISYLETRIVSNEICICTETIYLREHYLYCSRNHLPIWNLITKCFLEYVFSLGLESVGETNKSEYEPDENRFGSYWRSLFKIRY